MLRLTVLGEILRRGAKHATIRSEILADERRVAHLADVDHELPHVIRNTRGSIGEREADRHFRVLASKASNYGGDITLPETQRRDHTQCASHRASPGRQHVGQIVDLPANSARMRREQLTFVGQNETPPGSIEQARMQPRFELLQSLRHGWRRDIQLARCVGQRR